MKPVWNGLVPGYISQNAVNLELEQGCFTFWYYIPTKWLHPLCVNIHPALQTWEQIYWRLLEHSAGPDVISRQRCWNKFIRNVNTMSLIATCIPNQPGFAIPLLRKLYISCSSMIVLLMCQNLVEISAVTDIILRNGINLSFWQHLCLVCSVSSLIYPSNQSFRLSWACPSQHRKNEPCDE